MTQLIDVLSNSMEHFDKLEFIKLFRSEFSTKFLSELWDYYWNQLDAYARLEYDIEEWTELIQELHSSKQL